MYREGTGDESLRSTVGVFKGSEMVVVTQGPVM